MEVVETYQIEEGGVNLKLKHDCVRALLLAIEADIPHGEFLYADDLREKQDLKNFNIEDVVYTIEKLEEAGFINANVLKSLSDVESAYVESLTFSGHTFLDNIRDDGIWKETKSKAAQVGSASLGILADIAGSYIKQKLGLD